MARISKKLTPKERETYAIIGSRGGKASFQKLGSAHFAEIGKKGAKSRWSKRKKI